MTIEKRGVVEPGRTKDTESKVKGEKQAGDKVAQREALDDDFTKRAADKAADSLK